MCLSRPTMAAGSFGPKGREHIIEAAGEHVTSVRRPDAAHQGRLQDGTIRPAAAEEFEKLKALIQ